MNYTNSIKNSFGQGKCQSYSMTPRKWITDTQFDIDWDPFFNSGVEFVLYCGRTYDPDLSQGQLSHENFELFLPVWTRSLWGITGFAVFNIFHPLSTNCTATIELRCCSCCEKWKAWLWNGTNHTPTKFECSSLHTWVWGTYQVNPDIQLWSWNKYDNFY